MPRIFPVVVKRIAAAVSGAVNFKFVVKPAIRMRTVLSATLSTVKTGVRITFAPITAVMSQKVGLRFSVFNSGSAARTDNKVGLRLSNKSSGTYKPQTKPAVNIQQVTYDLAHFSGGSAVTQEGGCTGRSDWTNTANALGVNDATLATIAGNATGARDGILVLNYANFANKSALNITSVLLHFWCRQTGTTLNNGNHDHRWRKNGGAWTILETFTGNHDSLITPLTYDITAGITGWSDLDSIETGCRACMDLGEAVVASAVDAIELDVEANLVDVI